jgi:hypothetical protein
MRQSNWLLSSLSFLEIRLQTIWKSISMDLKNLWALLWKNTKQLRFQLTFWTWKLHVDDMKSGFFHNEDLIYGRVDMNFVHNILAQYIWSFVGETKIAKTIQGKLWMLHVTWGEGAREMLHNSYLYSMVLASCTTKALV